MRGSIRPLTFNYLRMKKRNKIILIIVIVVAAIQFIRPAKNYTTEDSPADIGYKYDVPMNVLMTFNDACYNCHSNYSKYPWYYNVQPVGWWMAYHIEEGKKHLNFSEFGNYTPVQAAKKFKSIYHEMDEKGMPLKSYLLEHPEARLSDEKYKIVADWALKMSKGMIQPADSSAGAK